MTPSSRAQPRLIRPLGPSSSSLRAHRRHYCRLRSRASYPTALIFAATSYRWGLLPHIRVTFVAVERATHRWRPRPDSANTTREKKPDDSEVDCDDVPCLQSETTHMQALSSAFPRITCQPLRLHLLFCSKERTLAVVGVFVATGSASTSFESCWLARLPKEHYDDPDSRMGRFISCAIQFTFALY